MKTKKISLKKCKRKYKIKFKKFKRFLKEINWSCDNLSNNIK